MKLETKIIALVLLSLFMGTQFLSGASCGVGNSCDSANQSGCEDMRDCKPDGINENRMLIPEDKNFSENFVKKLYARGKKEVYSGKVLETIGMPCGGIGSGQLYISGDGTLADWQLFGFADSRWVEKGQLYISGDGTLADWQLFGFADSRWVEKTASTFAYQKVRKPVEQGFAVTYKTDGSKTFVKELASIPNEYSEKKLQLVTVKKVVL